MRRAVLSRHCIESLGPDAGRAVVEQMTRLLRSEIDERGGLRAWLEWARTVDRCPIVAPRRGRGRHARP